MSVDRIPLVYIVDDDETFNKLIHVVLKKYGIRSETFKTSEAVLKRAKSYSPDLCIVDLNLGSYEKGYDLIASLRQVSNPDMPIIICSSEKEKSVISHALEMGANDYLLKPLDRDVLTAKLLQFINTVELGFTQTGGPSGAALQAEINTTLSLNLTLASVEEDGFSLLSKHLILKGTVVTFGGEVMKEISGRETPLMATVLSSELSPKEETYLIYLEFDANDSQLIDNIRVWLSMRWTRPDALKPDLDETADES